MAEAVPAGPVLRALLSELSAQGHVGTGSYDAGRLATYPIKGTLDVLALAEAVESALGGNAADDEGKTPSDLNAANDG